MWVEGVRQFCKVDEAGNSLVCAAMSQLNFCAGSDDIQSVHLAEAL